MKRKIIAAALSVSLLFSSAVFCFADGEWWRSGFDYVYYSDPKIMELDQPEGVFHPYREVTRLEVADALWKQDGKPDTETVRFWDIRDEAVDYVANAGIMQGVDDRHFDPDGRVTREQMATIACRFAMAAGYNVRFPSRIPVRFGDTDQISDYAYGSVAWAVETGLMSGTGNGFEPRSYLNRGQIATILMRLADLVGDQKVFRQEVRRIEANEGRTVGKEDDREIFVDNLGWLLRQTNSGVVECFYDARKDEILICFQDHEATVSVDGLTYLEIVDKVLTKVW